MPIYEFLCPECNRIYSFMYPTMSDDSPPCPKCGSQQMERQVSLFAFVRGGTNPLAAIPKRQEDEVAQDAPVHDDGLYFP